PAAICMGDIAVLAMYKFKASRTAQLVRYRGSCLVSLHESVHSVVLQSMGLLPSSYCGCGDDSPSTLPANISLLLFRLFDCAVFLLEQSNFSIGIPLSGSSVQSFRAKCTRHVGWVVFSRASRWVS